MCIFWRNSAVLVVQPELIRRDIRAFAVAFLAANKPDPAFADGSGAVILLTMADVTVLLIERICGLADPASTAYLSDMWTGNSAAVLRRSSVFGNAPGFF